MLVDVGSAGGGEPDWCGVREYWFGDGFEGEEYGLFVLAPGCACEGFQFLEAARCSEGEHGVKCHAENFGFLASRDGDIVDEDDWFGIHSASLGSEECDR